MAYLILKWLHVLSAMVLVGVGFGTAFYKWMADRSGDLHTIAQVSRIVVIADWLFTTPAIFVQPLTGLAMAHLAGYPLSSRWLVATALLYVLAGACWIPVLILQYRMRRLARFALANGGTLSPEYGQAARLWLRLGIPAFAAMLAIYGLMIFKPA